MTAKHNSADHEIGKMKSSYFNFCMIGYEIIRSKFLWIVSAIGISLIMSGCGYRWAAAYETQPSLSYWAIVDLTQSDPMKAQIAQFSDQNNFRRTVTIHTQLNPGGSIFSAYLEKGSTLASITNVPNGCVLNIGFYKARIGGLSDSQLEKLAAQFAGLMDDVGVKVNDKPMSVDDNIPACDNPP